MAFVAMVLMIVSEGTGLVNPLIIAKGYDALVNPELEENERLTEINKYMSLVMFVFLVGTFAGFLRASLLGVIGERVVSRIRNRLYASILKQDMAFFDEHKSGELTSRLSSDTTVLQLASAQSVPEVLVGVVKVVVSMILMFWISIKLAALTVGGVAFVFILAMPFGAIIAKLSKDYQDVLGEAQSRSTEALGAMRTVQSFAAEKKEEQKYLAKIGDPDSFPFWWPYHCCRKRNDDQNNDEDIQTAYRVGFFKAVTSAGFFVFIFGAGFGLMYVMLWYGFHQVADGHITLGELTAFQSYIFQIGFGLGTLTSHVVKTLEAIGASGRLFYLLERVPAIPKPTDGEVTTHKDKTTTAITTTTATSPTAHDRPSIQGRVGFHNVTFSYPSRPNNTVLNDFTLEVPANTTAALVGSSGAGKSTVIALLQRFYDVDMGTIEVDGHDITTMDLKWLRSQIGYVQQEPQLFGMSVRENILYGVDRTVSQEELEQVCRDANCHEFISTWPEGYNTLVGERGVKLSGGQKQRIAIARALICRCPILLLDEATSALDAESEHLVQEAIDRVVMGRTVIIVAHRLSTIQRASQIVVVENHRIADVGTHEQLLERCAKYQDLIKRQNMAANNKSFDPSPNLSLSQTQY